MAKVTITDIAREAGVSVGTVSNALNHPDKVRPDTLELISSAIDKLGYVPNQAARQLAGGESRVFGLVLPRLDHAFSLQIANGAQTESRAHGYDLLIANAGNNDILENHYMRYFLGAQMAGVLVQPMAGEDWRPPFETTRVPTVYLDVHCSEAGTFVAADNEAQGRLMVEHAIACGAKRVAVIGEPAFMQLSLRAHGMCAAAENTGVQLELLARGDWNSVGDGFNLGRELAQRTAKKRPDFVIALTDVLAAGAIDGILATGLEVPGDMLVAGCDGNPLAWGGSVPLTTIASPGFEIGRRGVQLLLEQGGSQRRLAKGKGLQELVSSQLIPRASTATSKASRAHADLPDLNLGEYL